MCLPKNIKTEPKLLFGNQFSDEFAYFTLSLKLCEEKAGLKCDKNGILDFFNEAGPLKVTYVENFVDFNNEERPGQVFNSYKQLHKYRIENLQSKTEVNYSVRKISVNEVDKLEAVISGEFFHESVQRTNILKSQPVIKSKTDADTEIFKISLWTDNMQSYTVISRYNFID